MKFLYMTIMVAGLAACGEGGPDTAASPSAAAQAPAAGTSDRRPVALVNAVRRAAGRAPIRRNARLDRAAQIHANDMARNSFFAHTGSDGSKLKDRVNRTGYGWCFLAENIAEGYPSRQAAITGWKGSPGHYRNMVNPKAEEFGIAAVGGYQVMVLGAGSC
ncbi:CAP domain-containing protein [Sulfitobacter albidus]|uniref:CAP domain-containing protein n=1 Tax=Sulfitobacter albidus TaxID=2829501 RepID=A0A975JEL9_9RHOB|nr:CAP domain-containing protein [Sulfitobacter albidus]QUJ77038.1 CAP domain-containing protein [Sulfitobacter albidus]